MPPQEIVTYWLFLIGMWWCAAAIWTGAARGWTNNPTAMRNAPLSIPWLAALSAVALLPRLLGIELPPVLRDALLLLFSFLGLCAMSIQRPKWALPRWFVEHEAARKRSKERPHTKQS